MKEEKKGEKSKKQLNIVFYTAIMICIFYIITEKIIWGSGSSYLIDAFFNYRNGKSVIVEAILASMVLVVMLLFGNSYVFTQKKEKVTKGLFYGLFYLIVAVLFFCFAALAGGFSDHHAAINTFIFCLLVGITEEFLCRGWLLNEFLERYGNTKKGVWLSIIISGAIFGLMHLFNIVHGQAVASTITQFLNATGIGIILGVIYYKTKNIWSAVIIHGFWDFSLMLTQVRPITEGNAVFNNNAILSIVTGILLFVVSLLNIIPYIKDIDKEPKKNDIIKYAIISAIAYPILMYSLAFVELIDKNTLMETTQYDNISIERYSKTTDNFNTYTMKQGATKINFYVSEHNNLKLVNPNTGKSVIIECENLYDYIIVENGKDYTLAYIDYKSNSFVKLYYVYINKVTINDTDEFLENVKNNIKGLVLPERGELVSIKDQKGNISYVAACNSNDYGCLLLTSDKKLSLLNQ